MPSGRGGPAIALLSRPSRTARPSARPSAAPRWRSARGPATRRRIASTWWTARRPRRPRRGRSPPAPASAAADQPVAVRLGQVASPKRRSSVRQRRSSRLWASSTCLRPGIALAPNSSACSARAASSAACCSRRGARASSADASSSAATTAATAPVPSSRDGTDLHCCWRATKPGSATSSRARSSRPPEAWATESACSRSTPRATSQSTTSPSRHGIEGDLARTGWRWWRGGREIVGQQDEHGGRRWLLHRLEEGGRPLAARWTSVTISTWRDASSGRRWARVTMDRASSTSSEAPVRSTTTRSGWVPASARRHVLQWPQPPSGHSRAAARPRAAARFPEPGGPWSR